MAMLEGTVVINPATGSASGVGAAKEVFDAMDAGQDYQGLSGSELAVAREQIAVQARAIAKIIPHIVANAQVTTTVAPGIAVATAGTAAAQTGSTTAPGTGTGTVV